MFYYFRRNRRKKFHIVTEDWVGESLQEVKLQPEQNYEPL